jgi:hypothetical protein
MSNELHDAATVALHTVGLDHWAKVTRKRRGAGLGPDNTPAHVRVGSPRHCRGAASFPRPRPRKESSCVPRRQLGS